MKWSDKTPKCRHGVGPTQAPSASAGWRPPALALGACGPFLVAAVIVTGIGRADEAPNAKEIAIAEINRGTRVDFANEIAPILKAGCLACHNGNTSKGDLNLESPESMLQGGTNGPALVAGESKKSRLLLSAAHRLKPLMPPLNNRVGAQALTPEQLGLIRLWIDQGAKGSPATRPMAIAWQPPAVGLQPILALALTPDAKYVACSRGEQLFLYDLPAARLVSQLVDPELSGPGRAHIDFVRSLAFSPRGDILASGGFRTVKLWQRPRTQRQKTLDLDETATAVAIHPAGTSTAFGQAGGRIALYDLASGKRIRELVAPRGATSVSRNLCYAPDGSRLYSASGEGNVCVWNVEDGASLGTLTTSAPVRALALLNQGSQLVTAHEDGQLRVWDVAALAGKARPVAEIKAHTKPIISLAAVPSAPNELVSASEDGRLCRWDVRTAKLLREVNHGGPITAVAVAPNGIRFASVGNQVVRLWETATGALVAERKGDHRALARAQLAEGEIEFAKMDLYFRKQELREAEEALKRETAILEGAKKQVEQAEKTLAEKKKAAQQPLADSAAAAKAATVAAEALQQANLARKQAESAVAQARKTPAAVAQLQAAEKTLKAASEAVPVAERKSREAATLANQAREKARVVESQLKEAETAVETAQFTVNTSRQVLQRDQLVPRSKQAVAAAESTLQQREAAKKTAEQAVPATQRPWRSVAFSSDSSWLLVSGEDPLIHVFDAQQGFPTEVLEGATGVVLKLAAGAKGKIVALSADKQAVVWQAAGTWTLGRTIGRLDDPKVLADRVLKVAFHPNGKWLATAGGEPGRPGELKIWDVTDGRLVRGFPDAHRDTIFGVQFSPNGDFLASAGADRLVKIFSTADGKLIRTLTGHTHHVRGVAWRADGKVLASCGADKMIKVWNAEDGTLLRTETGDFNRRSEYRREVTSISFVGGSDLMLATSGDKTVRLHHTSSHQGVRTCAGQYAFQYAGVATADGKQILAGGHDGILRLWNGANGYLIKEFPPPATTTESSRK